jgi:regulator of replication initiation timing
MTEKIKYLFTKAIYNVYRCPNETLDAIEGLMRDVYSLLDENAKLKKENKILNLMTKTSDEATGIINDQNLHRLLLKFYDLFTEHFAPEDEFKIDVDFDPEDEINEDRIAITVLTKSDDIEG